MLIGRENSLELGLGEQGLSGKGRPIPPAAAERVPACPISVPYLAPVDSQYHCQRPSSLRCSAIHASLRTLHSFCIALRNESKAHQDLVSPSGKWAVTFYKDSITKMPYTPKCSPEAPLPCRLSSFAYSLPQQLQPFTLAKKGENRHEALHQSYLRHTHLAPPTFRLPGLLQWEVIILHPFCSPCPFHQQPECFCSPATCLLVPIILPPHLYPLDALLLSFLLGA